MTAIAIAATAASSLIGFMGNMAASQTASRIGAANAALTGFDIQVADHNKTAIEQKFQLDTERADIEFKGLQAETAMAYRFRGVDLSEGTPLDMLTRNVEEYEFDKLIAEREKDLQIQKQTQFQSFKRMERDIGLMTAKAQSSAFRQQGFASLLGGAAKTATMYEDAYL
tara:strand:+ start:134 stop:640 length:507 start_codon:yes stop_codon:yes gene_type:complete